MKEFLKPTLPGILWGFLIIFLTALPGKVFPKLPSFADLLQPDKVVHVVVFAVFIFLQVKGYRVQTVFRFMKQHPIIIALTIGLMLGAGTELMQAWWIPMRRGSLFDFMANAAGCLAGYVCVRKWLYTS